MKKFELIEHTADIGIKVYGQSLPELFQNSAEAMFSLLLNCKPQESLQKDIILEAVSFEELLVVWLNELLSLFYAENFLPASFSIKINENPGLKSMTVSAKGQCFDPYASKLNTEIKAVTYHDLKIEKNEQEFSVQIIFDV